MDRGFLQILITTSNSKACNEAASSGALGGQENVPEELKKLKVKNGQLTSGEGEMKTVRMRVGFGVEDEVLPIQKGVKYGAVGDTRSSFGSV